MDKELKDKVIAVAREKGYGQTDSDIAEIIREGETLNKECHLGHYQQYELIQRVVKVGDFYIHFEDVINTGDDPTISGKEIIELIMNSAYEVVPIEVKAIEFFPLKHK